MSVSSCAWVSVLQGMMAAVGAAGPGPTDCVTKVAISVSCENLLDKDTFSKSDPLCVLYMNSSGPHWCEVRRSACCKLYKRYFQYWYTMIWTDTSAVCFFCHFGNVSLLWVNTSPCTKKVHDWETSVCVRLDGQRKSRTASIPSFPRLLWLTTTLRWCRSWGLNCTTLTATSAACKTPTSWESWSVPWDRLALYAYLE